jgi:hypothetical protein
MEYVTILGIFRSENAFQEHLGQNARDTNNVILQGGK